MLTILLDGVAYGMLLFVLASGLSVTLGLMNFINLAHGAFAMIGGYVTALLMNRAGVPFLATLPAAFLIPATVGVVLERTLYRRLYGASPLDQVLFTIGLVLMAMPIAAYFIGDEPQQVHLPAWLSGRIEIHGVGIGVYRLFIIVVCGAIAAALQMFLIKTRFGAQLRAAVDDARVAQGLGINVDRIFAVAFAVGSGLAPKVADKACVRVRRRELRGWRTPQAGWREMEREQRRHVAADHCEGAMGEVDEVHQPQRHRQPARQHEQQHA